MDPSHTFPALIRPCADPRWMHPEPLMTDVCECGHAHAVHAYVSPPDVAPALWHCPICSAVAEPREVLDELRAMRAELRELREDLAPVFRLLAQVQQVPRLAKALARTDV